MVEQIIRPTGLMDPEITRQARHPPGGRPAGGNRQRVGRGERVLVTTLTKRMAEDLTEYYQELGVKVRYLHSDINTLERMEIIRDLRLGEFDVLIGINLLREGLDLPEVSLVAILDADKEGFLRSSALSDPDLRPGRPERPGGGAVLRRPSHPLHAGGHRGDRPPAPAPGDYNQEHGITPETIKSSIKDILASVYEADYVTVPLAAEEQASYLVEDLPGQITRLKKEMKAAAKKLEFEKAATLRDRIKELENAGLKFGGKVA